MMLISPLRFGTTTAPTKTPTKPKEDKPVKQPAPAPREPSKLPVTAPTEPAPKRAPGPKPGECVPNC